MDLDSTPEHQKTRAPEHKLEAMVLKELQNEFPLEPKPFKVIGDKLGMDEASIIECILSLKEKGIVREIGPIFNHKRLGLETYLIGIKVEDIEASARIINEYEEVTHNYERDYEFNLWCSFVGKKDKLGRIIEQIKKEIKPHQITVLPSLSSFKLLFELDI